MRLLALIPVFLLSACMATTSSVTTLPIPPSQPRLPVETIQLASPSGDIVSIEAEIAKTPEQQRIGLMNRKELDSNRGMLFVFEKEAPLDFWMKDTLIPLDILFFDTHGRLVSTATMEPCTDGNCSLYPSGGPARYALEIPAGEMQNRGIGEGWTLLL